MMEEIHTKRGRRGVGSRSLSQECITAAAIFGGAIVVAGAFLSWFSLFAGLKPYRGVDFWTGRLLAGCGALSMLAGVWFLWQHRRSLRWGIGLLGFAILVFASWSLIQLLILFRELTADPMMVVKLGPGLIVAVFGALLIFATLFLGEG